MHAHTLGLVPHNLGSVLTLVPQRPQGEEPAGDFNVLMKQDIVLTLLSPH